MLGPLLIRFGTEAQRREFLPRILSGEHIWCQGYSEPEAGSDLASLRTEAVADGDDYVVNGQKIWSTLAHDATHMFMLVRTDKEARPQRGISFLLVDLATPGITVRPIPDITGHEEFCEVFFRDVRVPKANLVGAPNEGWTMAKALLGFERLYSGSPKQAQYALSRLRVLARARGLFDDPVFRARFAEVELDASDAAAAYMHFATIVKRGGTLPPSISYLKVWATETYQRISMLLSEAAGEAGAGLGPQHFGASTVDVLAPLFNATPATIYGGSNEIQRNILARYVLELPT
jgi:alkylation response protein AidB-like acyl-CoA dehydrogenase